MLYSSFTLAKSISQLAQKKPRLRGRFLKLEGKTVAIDLMDYALPPVDWILGFLVWMVPER
ncbi:hypothetical protein [Floridanema evergladense]|uniref:Uncharacterized protein n=1 Tax=Floridaenema evergladense BLCC-F167 TaxID=3153639 RepID=A0ABV4WV16_9CYAN